MRSAHNDNAEPIESLYTKPVTCIGEGGYMPKKKPVQIFLNEDERLRLEFIASSLDRSLAWTVKRLVKWAGVTCINDGGEKWQIDENATQSMGLK